MNTRDVARKAVREQIALAALKRFKENGFENTTVEEIASDVGMSARTYFRYFRSKDDVLLEPALSFGKYFLERFEQLLGSEDLWNALQIALSYAIVECKAASHQHVFEIQLMVRSTPAVLARQLEINERLQLEATELYFSKCPSSEALSWHTINAIIGSAFACLQALQRTVPTVTTTNRVKAEDALRDIMQNLRPCVLESR